MLIGTTTFAWRYQLLDAATAPPLEILLEEARALGVEKLQICENARPDLLSDAQWRVLVNHARTLSLPLMLGCMTLDAGKIVMHLERAAMIPSDTVRVIFEMEEHNKPDREAIVRLLDQLLPRLEALDMRLAIENHFALSSKLLSEVVRQYPADRVSFCLDVANSLRSCESPERVFDLLEDRAHCYHFKDYRIEGSNVGFRVFGAPLGEGQLDLVGLLRRVYFQTKCPEVYVENWVPSTGDRNADSATDLEWLRRGIERLGQLKATLRVGSLGSGLDIPRGRMGSHLSFFEKHVDHIFALG